VCQGTLILALREAAGERGSKNPSETKQKRSKEGHSNQRTEAGSRARTRMRGRNKKGEPTETASTIVDGGKTPKS